MTFSLIANYTYADAKEKRSCPPPATPYDTCIKDLVGASKNTYNAIAYYEDYGFGARIAYNFRSHFFVGLDRSSPQYQDDTATVSASLSYTLNKNISFSFEALNINDPILKYYGANETQPRAFYANGRQYYFSVRVKL